MSEKLEPVRRAEAAFNAAGPWSSEEFVTRRSFDVTVVDVLQETEDLLVIEERVRGRGLESGVEVEMSLFSAYLFRDGRVARRTVYKDRREALDARIRPAGRTEFLPDEG